VTDKLVA